VSVGKVPARAKPHEHIGAGRVRLNSRSPGGWVEVDSRWKSTMPKRERKAKRKRTDTERIDGLAELCDVELHYLIDDWDSGSVSESLREAIDRTLDRRERERRRAKR
jgi:hypothetical protein